MFLEVAEGPCQNEGTGRDFPLSTHWENHAAAKVMNAESFCLSELGFPKQLKARDMCF